LRVVLEKGKTLGWFRVRVLFREILLFLFVALVEFIKLGMHVITVAVLEIYWGKES
jgi:DNA-binding Lrp family transcriptional regulator